MLSKINLLHATPSQSSFQGTHPDTVGTWKGPWKQSIWQMAWLVCQGLGREQCKQWGQGCLGRRHLDGPMWAPPAGAVKEELNNHVTQLADVSQPLSRPHPHPTQCSCSGLMHRAPGTAETKAYAGTWQHTHNG